MCGLSTRKVETPCSTQKSTTRRISSHSAAQAGAREVQREDVLVLLGRVLRVLDGAVRPVAEPLRMLAHPRVVRRALQREVEGHFHVMGGGGAHEATEVVEGSQLRVHRGVPALRSADRPRAARIAGRGASGGCSGPCGWSGRSGGWAAGTATSKPMRWMSGRRSMQSANVPWRPGSRPWDRGNSSYHAAKRARSRSTVTPSSRSKRVRSLRSWARAMAARRRGSRSTQALVARGPAASVSARARRSTAASSPWARPAAASTRARPSRSSLASSRWPPAIRRPISSTHEPNVSVQASMV